LREAIDRSRSGVLLVTETNLPHADNVSYLAPGEADAVYQFPLPPLVAHAFVAADARPLVRWLRALDFPRPPATYLNVLATHDGIGLRGAEGWLDDAGRRALVAATTAAGGVVNARSTADGDVPYELAVSWIDLLGHDVAEGAAIARHLASHAIALALRGHPLLYLNSLFGVGNDVTTFAATGHGRDLNRARLRRGDVDGARRDPASRTSQVWSGICEMLDARASSPAFHPAAAQVIHDRGREVVVIERASEGGERAIVAVNVTDRAVPVELPGAGQVTLMPYEARWRCAP
jgi:glucosylglycerate phosphorylase